ncbi:MAG: YqaA family protein [Rikenellaceae bacterium]
MNIIKKCYNWVLGWAESKWGAVALFVLAFAESSFFPIPPDVLLIALCLGRPKRSFFYAGVCTLASVCGAMGGYVIGHYLWTGMSDWFIPSVFSQEAFESVAAIYNKWDFWAVFTAGFTPIPYKIFTITAGVFDINFVMFVLASVVSRGLRFCLLGFLIWRFGAPIKVFIDKYFNLLAVLLTLLIVGGFVLLKYVI